METLTAVVGIVGLLAVSAGAVMMAVNAIRRRSLRMWAMTAGTGFVVLVVMVAISPSADDAPQASPEQTSAADPTPTVAPTPTPTPLTVSIAQLRQEYDANQIAADRKYKDQVMEVTRGTITNISKTLGGRPYLTLGTGAAFELWSLQCRFDHEDALLAVERGQIVSIRGTNQGMSFGSVMFDRCKIVE